MNLYSTEDAAAYLGIKPETVRHHVYTSKRLTPQHIGGSLVFTQEQLDEFKRNHPRRGRPCIHGRRSKFRHKPE